MMQITPHQPLRHLTWHTSLVTDVDWNKVQKTDAQNINASTSGWYLLRMVADWDILLIKHHQLMMKSAAQPSSSVTASSEDADRPCDWCALQPQHMCPLCVQRSDVHNTNASIFGYLIISPRSSIIASCATDLVTDVHWNHSICAQVPVQRSDVSWACPRKHKWARSWNIMSWWWNLLLSPAHQMQICLLTDVHCNRSICAQSKYSAQMCITPMQAYLGAWCSWVSCTQPVAAYWDMMSSR